MGSSQACQAKGAEVSNGSAGGVWVPPPVGYPAKIPFLNQVSEVLSCSPPKLRCLRMCPARGYIIMVRQPQEGCRDTPTLSHVLPLPLLLPSSLMPHQTLQGPCGTPKIQTGRAERSFLGPTQCSVTHTFRYVLSDYKLFILKH